jgi:hypothetical protein
MNSTKNHQDQSPTKDEVAFVEALASLLEKMDKVFGDELDGLTTTQEAILNGLLSDRIKAQGGDPSRVTIDEVEGCRELLYTHFTMAAVQ